VVSPVPSLIDITSARWWLEMNSTPFMISGMATFSAGSPVTSVSAGVAEMMIFAYGATRWAAITSRVSSPFHALHDP
jgi:hypothetical protein